MNKITEFLEETINPIDLWIERQVQNGWDKSADKKAQKVIKREPSALFERHQIKREVKKQRLEIYAAVTAIVGGIVEDYILMIANYAQRIKEGYQEPPEVAIEDAREMWSPKTFLGSEHLAKYMPDTVIIMAVLLKHIHQPIRQITYLFALALGAVIYGRLVRQRLEIADGPKPEINRVARFTKLLVLALVAPTLSMNFVDHSWVEQLLALGCDEGSTTPENIDRALRYLAGTMSASVLYLAEGEPDHGHKSKAKKEDLAADVSEA